MKISACLFIACVSLWLFSSCNNDEGLGGSSSIEGYVYSIVHLDDNFSFTTDTVPAVGEKVYIVYGGNENDPIANKDVDTNKNGLYRFEYLRKGNYVVYALSSYPDELDKKKEAKDDELKLVNVGSSGTAHADNIYIHKGKAYGLSMIKGTVIAQYYDKSSPEGGPVPAVETRVYLKRAGEDTHFDDVRVGDQGVFVFQKVPPGKGKYEVYTTTEKKGIKNKIEATPVQTIEVSEAHKVYELPETFHIIINI